MQNKTIAIGKKKINLNNKPYIIAEIGSNFNQNGSVANGPAAQSLKQYSTSLNGNKLRVFE